jgi:hypothetical protein
MAMAQNNFQTLLFIVARNCRVKQMGTNKACGSAKSSWKSTDCPFDDFRVPMLGKKPRENQRRIFKTGNLRAHSKVPLGIIKPRPLPKARRGGVALSCELMIHLQFSADTIGGFMGSIANWSRGFWTALHVDESTCQAHRSPRLCRGLAQRSIKRILKLWFTVVLRSPARSIDDVFFAAHFTTFLFADNCLDVKVLKTRVKCEGNNLDILSSKTLVCLRIIFPSLFPRDCHRRRELILGVVKSIPTIQKSNKHFS